ncbi:hypothetical protein AEYBE204_05640 [Asticcacaulis sp. YBE204]|nr:hypothetical protein AEYBE204_05640 [Asticcacaulis sp. YBE204]
MIGGGAAIPDQFIGDAVGHGRILPDQRLRPPDRQIDRLKDDRAINKPRYDRPALREAHFRAHLCGNHQPAIGR